MIDEARFLLEKGNLWNGWTQRGQPFFYLPTYHWVLVHCLQKELVQLQEQAEKQTVILLDYETNCDVADLSHLLSHAGLVKRYLEGQWPDFGESQEAEA